MDNKAVAKETVDIMKKGYYETEGCRISIEELQEHSMRESFIITPEQGDALLKEWEASANHCTGVQKPADIKTCNCSTVDALLQLAAEEKKEIGILNFASAKNPGGGFIKGAMAQEESIATSSCLYNTLLLHEEYYYKNRVCGTMMYTDYAIYSPEVVFFRNGKFQLLKEPVTASVLTLPAVNMGQIMLRGEDVEQAEQVMKRRMKLSLAIFAKQECRHLILGAYGCGVFRNDPKKIAKWWQEFLKDSFADVFETVVFAVLDKSSTQDCIKAFQEM